MDEDVQAEDRPQNAEPDTLTVPLSDDEQRVLGAALGGA